MLYESSRKRLRPKLSCLHPNPGFKGRDEIGGRFGRSHVLRVPKRRYVFCHYCGYTPKGNRTDLPCPKCDHHAWECGEVDQKIIVP